MKLAAPGGAAKPAAKKTTAAAKPKVAKATTTKKPAVKKAKTTTATTAKKPAAKKATATKAKSKANTTKVRKTPAAVSDCPDCELEHLLIFVQAPAVVEEKPVVLGKTKSGRVTKSKAPAEARKAVAPKKARKAPAKKATPKKA